MVRFFFHIHNGIGFASDNEGVCLPGLDAARAQAIVSIRSILAEEIKDNGVVDLRGRIDIMDEHGTVTSVEFAEAVEVRGAG